MIGTWLIEVLDWSEVWALLIPLAVLLFYRSMPGLLFPIPLYLMIALFLNLFITLISNVPAIDYYFASNHIFYNVHSVIKVIFFGWFILRYLPAASANIVRLI